MTDALPTVALEINRNEPTLLGSLDLSAVIGFGRIFTALVTDSYLYAGNVSSNEVEIYDISTPASPTLVGTIAAITGEYTNLANGMVLDPGGNYLYVAVGSDKVYALDVNADPEIPTVANTWTLTETASGSAVVTLDAANTRLYVLSQGGSKFYHADIVTPGTFASTGSISASNTIASCQHGVVSPDGDYVVYPSGTSASPAQLGFVDISTPGTPTEGTPIALPTTIETSAAITPTNSIFFANTSQLGLIGNFTDANGLKQYFWLIYNKGADWEAATIVSHTVASSQISPLKNASGCHGRLSVTTSPEIPLFASPQASATYLFVPIQNNDSLEGGRMAIYDFPSGAAHPPQPRSSLLYSGALYAIGPLAITSSGVIACIGTRTTGTPQALVTFQEPAGWTAITTDLLGTPGVTMRWGISGSGPSDRVAETGTMSFEMNNVDLGEFSPDHSNRMAQFTVGRAIRFTVTYSGSSRIWYGVIFSITPNAGQYNPRRVSVTCVDYMDYLAKASIQGLPVESNVLAGVAFLRMVSRVRAQPPSFNLELTANDLYPTAFDQMKDEEQQIISEIQRLANSDRSFVYVQDGALTYEQRTTRAAKVLAGPDVTLTDANIHGLAIEHSAGNIFNLVQAQVFPRATDASPAVLFTQSDKPLILRGVSHVFDAPYSDVSQKAARAAGKDMIAPVATTDYTFNTAEDGSGANVVGQLTILSEFGGNSARITVTNNGPADGYLTLFRLRGTGLYSFEPVTVSASDENSRGQYGPSDLMYSMPYHSSTPIAEDAASYLVSALANPKTFVRSVDLRLNETAMLTNFVTGNLNIGSLVRITETATGLANSDHFVRSADVTIVNAGSINGTFGLVPAARDVVWLLDQAGFTELGTTTFLGSAFTT